MPIATPQGTLDFKSVDTITFVGASSNTVIDTTTGSLGVGVDVNGPTSNLHVVGHTRLEGDINMLHTSNNSSMKVNSNVVTEFPRSKKLIKYPRVAMTADNQPTGYVASASTSTSNREPYQAFDNVLYSSWHEPVYQPSPYPNIDGAYTGGSGTVYDTNGYQGEYLQIQLPEKIKLYNYSISNRPAAGIEGRQPKDAKIFASNDGTTWIDIHTHSDGGGTYDIAGETRSFQLDNITETHYKYYRLVVNSIIQGGSSDTANISQWQLYGTPEYDPEADGTDVVVKSVPNVPNTDWLEVYYDAKNYTSGTTVQDETANNRDGTLYGDAGLDSVDGIHKFDFDGNGDYIKTTLSGFTGTTVTFSAWVFMDSVDTTRAQTIMGLGNWGDNGSASWIAVGTGGVLETGNKGIASCGSPVQANTLTGRWLHITGIVSSGDFRLYQDGQLIKSLTTTGTINYGTNPVLYIATRADSSGNPEATRYFDCKIANARLFNRALTSDEIYQLYAYQKEYFGHGDLGMTLKAGRLGIGTSEPRVALDVRGDIIGGCPAAFSVAYNPTSLSGNQTIIWNLVYHNVGSGYNSSNGLFTAPVSGYYHFTVWGMTSSSTSGVVEFQFMKNGSIVQQRPYGNAGSNYGNATGSIIEYLNIGDTMSIFLTNSTTMYASTNQSYNGFSGFYLSS